MLKGQADCGFISLPAPAEKYLDCWLLQRDQWKVIVPCNHPLAGADPFPPEALEQYPLILLDEGDDYEIQAVFDTLGLKPKIQYTVQQDQTILAMVSNGLGISVMEELMLYPLCLSAGGLFPAPAVLPGTSHLRQGQERPVQQHPCLHRPYPPLGAGQFPRRLERPAACRPLKTATPRRPAPS